MDEIKINENELYQITNDSEAEEAVKIILEAKEERDRLLDLVTVEQIKLEAKAAKIGDTYKSKTEFLLQKLREYVSTVKTHETKTQSKYKLLSGDIVIKKATQKMVKDDKALTLWLQDNAPEFIKTTYEPRWGDFKRFLSAEGNNITFTKTGEILDCVSLQDVPESIEVQ